MAGDKYNNMGNMEQSAQEYLIKHKILELCENLTACLMFERPEKPKTFMITYIKELMESRVIEIDYPCLIDSSNIKCLFGMLDALSSGYISFDQYKSAYKAIGAKTCDGDHSPEVASDEISFAMFLTTIKEGLSRASATFTSQKTS